MQCYEYEDDVYALYILFQYYSSRMLKDIKCTEKERERFGVSRARELEGKERERKLSEDECTRALLFCTFLRL